MGRAPDDGGGRAELKVDPSERPRRAVPGAKPPRPKPPRPRAAPRPAGRRWLGLALRLLVSLAIWVTVAVAAVLAYYAYDLPDVGSLTATTRRPSVTFLAADGESFAAYGDVYGEVMALRELPPHLPQAVLATEDRRFYAHFGIDPFGILRAAVANLRAGRLVQGGSTITQQLAKNLFLTPERSLRRKAQEFLMALWLERRFSKDQILTMYLNRVYLGGGTWGVDAAARRYYGVPASKLTPYQSASIAGLLKAPSRYNPHSDAAAARQRTRQVLTNMVEAGYLSPAQAEAAERAGPGTVRRAPEGGRYFADWLFDRVGDLVGDAARDLTVATTLDLGLQRKVEAELERALAGPGARLDIGQGAVVVMGHDGAVRAMAGGRDYGDSQFNRATQGLRQPGSAFKPVIYLAALEAGWSPEDVIEDAPLKLGKWRPRNFTNDYAGPVSLRRALSRSINTVAVRLSEQVGRKRVIATARRLGISTDLPDDASLALGTGEVTPLELTGAYAVLANGGSAVQPWGIREIRQRDGRVLYRHDGGPGDRGFHAGVVARLDGMLAGVLQEGGTGRAAALDRPAAGKTGTTSEHRDAWFAGFTADLVATVWLGNDDAQPMRKVTGGQLPAELWKRIMLAAHRGLPPRPLPADAAPPPAWAGAGGGVGAGGAGSPAAVGLDTERAGFTPPPPTGEDGVWNALVRRLTGR